MPLTSAATAQAFQSITSAVSSSGISVSWLSAAGSSTPSSSASYIWASNSNNPPGSNANAKLSQHPNKQRGHFTVDFTAAYTPSSASSTSSSQAGSSTPNSATADISNRNLGDASVRVQLAHVIVMAVAFLGIFPTGALVARYGRTFTSKWFPSHHYIQLFGAVMTIVGFAL